MKPENFDIDLGSDHYLQFTALESERIGAILYHNDCSLSIMFDCEIAKRNFKEKAYWKIENENPLTLSPSIVCSICKDHGNIVKGKWIQG